jgi:predicted metal-binding protein
VSLKLWGGKCGGALGLVFFCFLLTLAAVYADEISVPLQVVVSPKRLPAPDAGNYVGAEACFSCHPTQYRRWQDSRHARALASLNENHHQDNPGCIRCHSTGYGEEGGFDQNEQSLLLAGVQCEACHGRASRHLKDVNQRGWSEITACVDCQIKSICMVCHTPKHSPEFDFEKYLNQIRCGTD